MSEKRRSLHAEILERERKERRRYLLAARDQRIALALRGAGRHLPSEVQETVRLARHGGDHHDQAVPFSVTRLNTLGHLADPLDATDRGAAVLLNDQRHRWTLLTLWPLVSGRNVLRECFEDLLSSSVLALQTNRSPISRYGLDVDLQRPSRPWP